MDIVESIQTVLNSKMVFGKQFYESLFERNPQLREFFGDADMRQQAVLLTMQLSIIGEYYRRPSPTVEAYLQILGTKHLHKGIPREAYPQFCEVLLETLAQSHGADWDEALAKEWREAIDVTSQKMFEGYEREFHM